MEHWYAPKRACFTTALFCMAVVVGRPSAQQPREGRVGGVVLDVVGASIAGASVFVRRHTASDENLRLVARTDRKGDFQFALAEGGYDVLVVAPGFSAAVETVGVLPGRTKKTEWKLRPLDCDFPGMNCDTFQ